jgi:RNA polymerase sigma factor (sigma-70 family)
MADVNDNALIQEYAERNSESAFAALVQRHVNLVYSVAFRYVGNFQDAQDVTQAVFIILARKAGSLRGRSILTGWLYETTRLTASQLWRTKGRQHAREQEAYMQSILDQSGNEAVWRQLAPHLEAAMSRLRAADRELLALRFYENKTGAEAAALLGIGAEAAHKRTHRALEKLRKFFTKRGVDSTAATIAETISANSVQAAPMALAKSATAVALAKGAAAGGSTLILVKGALKIMAWTKMKAAIVACKRRLKSAAGGARKVRHLPRVGSLNGLKPHFFDRSV